MNYIKNSISFIILSWNSANTIKQCIDSIIVKCNNCQCNYEIIIVDNGSYDSTLDIINAAYTQQNITTIKLDRNYGTTYPRNLALKKAKFANICVMDSDAYFLEGDLQKIITLLEDSSVGIVAPQLILSDGSIQDSVKKFPSVVDKLLKIAKIVFKIQLPTYDLYEKFPFSQITEVDSAISACWFFRSELLKQVGFLDEKIFYSPEDIDYCLRIRIFGKKILYFPPLKLLHYTQQITHKKFMSKIALSHLKGLVYYFSKHRYIRYPRFL